MQLMVGRSLIKNVRYDRENVEGMEWMVIKFCIGLKVFVHNRTFPCGSVTLVLSEVAVGVIQMRGNCCLCGCRTRSCQYIVSLQVKCSNKIVTFVLLDMLVMDKAFFRKIQIDTKMSLDWKVRYQESCPPAIPSVDDNAQVFCSPQCPQRCIFARDFFWGGGPLPGSGTLRLAIMTYAVR